MGQTWKSTQDHSKWAISYTDAEEGEALFLVCIGDVNRMLKQEERGGGTVCFRNERLWSALLEALEYDVCVGKGRRGRLVMSATSL